MYYYKLVVIAFISVLSLWGQVRSQGDGIRRHFVENGPTGISVEAEEQRQRSPGPPGVVVNGPTGFSVEAQEQARAGPREFEEVEVDLQDASSDAGSPAFVEADVDLGRLDNDQDDLPSFVNGHSGSSVHQEELKAAARGVIPTDPDENKEKKQLAKGLYIHTTDWSTDASQWSFKGGEWALVSLPDAENHQNLPPPSVPSPALVVVTDDPLNKVYASHYLEGLENMTLHYSYYLSEGEPPQGVPELDVYQVQDEQHSVLVSSGSTHGDWADDSVVLPFSGSSKIVFVGWLKKLGNEIAIDDITISGVSAGTTENVDGKKELEKKAKATEEMKKVSTTKKSAGITEGQGDEEGTVIPDEVIEGTEKPQETGEGTNTTQESVGEGTEKTQEAVEGTGNTEEPEKGTEKPDEAGKMTENLEETEMTTINSNITVQGNDTNDMVEGTDISEQGNETYNTGITKSTDNPDQVNETVVSENSQGSFQANVTFAPQSTVAQVEETGTGTDTNITEFVDDNLTSTSVLNSDVDNSTDVPQVNQTALPNVTTEVEVTGEGNDTEILVTSAFPFNMTGNVDHNVTDIFTNGPVDTTVNPGILDTETSVLTNQTGSVATVSHTNLTETPGNNSSGGGNITTSLYLTTVQTTSDVSNPPPVNATSGPGGPIISSTTTSLIMTHSTSPSGSNGTSPGLATGVGNGTDSSGDVAGSSSSMSAFKVFMVICLLGLVVMGFLYWRRQRRRDDEIPVFTRSSQADYHNPTFTDDDANFASRGTGSNYKSFE